MTSKQPQILLYFRVSAVAMYILFSDVLFSQQFLFKVLTSAGNVEFRAGSTYAWEKINSGESLYNIHELQLGKKSYAALMYNDGRTLELSENGIYKIQDLSRKIITTKKTVTQKFASYIAQEIISDKSEKKDMRTFAAVVRVKPNHIEAAVPYFTKVQESSVDLVWYAYPISTEYLVTILNDDSSIIFMDVVKDTVFSLDSKSLNLYKEKNYKWFVSDAANPTIISDTNTISFLSDENKNKILDTLKLIDDEDQKSDAPMKILSLAYFYEINNLNIDALSHYEKIISLYTESEEFKKLFTKFLLKYKLFVKVSELLADV